MYELCSDVVKPGQVCSTSIFRGKMDKEKQKKFAMPGVRYLFAANGLLGYIVVYSMRVNINVAIVAMVNNTAVYHKDNVTSSDECRVTDPHPNNGSLAKNSKDGEFVWSPQLQGVVLGAFYYGYCVSQIPGGLMAEMFSGKWVFGIGNLVTALLTMLTPVAARHHVGSLIAVRVLQGLAQGVTTPAMNSMLGRWLPDTEKGLLYTLVHSGSNVGTLATMSLAGYLSGSDTLLGGWPSCFYFIGLFGCLWFLLWIFLVTDTPHTHPLMTKEELKYITSNQRMEISEKLPPIPWKRVFASVPFWTLIVAQTCQDWSFYTLMTDLPTFFATMLHFRIETNGFLSSVPHCLQTIVGLMVASVADLTIRKGLASTSFVRKFCNSVSGFGASLGLIAVCMSGCNVNMNVAFFMFSIAIGGFCYSGHELTLLDLSPEYAGTLYGIANTISNLTGFVTPLVAGALTDGNQTLGQWRIVFSITSALLALASFVFVLFSTTRKQDWAVTSPATKAVILNGSEEVSVNRKNYKLLE